VVTIFCGLPWWSFWYQEYVPPCLMNSGFVLQVEYDQFILFSKSWGACFYGESSFLGKICKDGQKINLSPLPVENKSAPFTSS
jgi:hypothetical protein